MGATGRGMDDGFSVGDSVDAYIEEAPQNEAKQKGEYGHYRV